MNLSLKERRFVAEYLIDQNATAAAKRAGYSARTAEVQGPRLLGKVRVRAAVDEKLSKIEQKSELTAEIVRTQILRLLTFEPANAFNSDGTLKRLADMDPQTRQAIAGVDVDENGGEVKRIRFTDRTRAAELAARALGMLSLGIHGKGGSPLVTSRPGVDIDFSSWSKQEILTALDKLKGTGLSH